MLYLSRLPTIKLLSILRLGILFTLLSCNVLQVDKQSLGNGKSTVLHRFESSVALIGDTLCRGYNIKNVRYQIVGAKEKSFVIQETEDFISGCGDMQPGLVSVQVWQDSSENSPIAQFQYPGIKGNVEIDGPLYRARTFEPLYKITKYSCSECPITYTYFNLLSGKQVFSATDSLLYFFANGTVRYLTLLTKDPENPADSANWNPGTAAIVQYGSGANTPKTLALPGDSFKLYTVDSVYFQAPQELWSADRVVVGHKLEDRENWPKDTIAVSGINIIVHLRPPYESGDELEYTVHIQNDSLVLGDLRRRSSK